MTRLLVVSPVFDEGAHLARTAVAVAAQHRPPDRWIVVDDGSRDDTLRVAREWEAELDFMTVVSAPPRADEKDGLAVASEARAFNLGLELAGWRDYDLIGKLDGDVELPPEWFAVLCADFAADPVLGLAGGRLVERDATGWHRIPIPAHHVHGAVKLYSRACLAAIGGVPERLAWDTIDETYARMRGFATRSLPTLVARHHRPFASAGGRLRGLARHGECAWILHYGPGWMLLRALKIGRNAPVGLSGLALLGGYLGAALGGVARVEDPEFRRFTRRELRGRVARRLRPARAVRAGALAGGALRP